MNAEAGQKIDPFPQPSWFHLGSGSMHSPAVDLSGLLTPVFTIVFVLWVIYSLVVAYHLFKYSSRSFLTFPLLALHIVISGALLLSAALGLK